MTDFAKLRETIERGGAARYHEAAAARGKLFARERIALLIDEGSFTEDGRYANALADGLPADGPNSAQTCGIEPEARIWVRKIRPAPRLPGNMSTWSVILAPAESTR